MGLDKIPNFRGVLFDIDGTLYHQNCLRFIIAIHFAFSAIINPLKTLRKIQIIRNYRRSQEWLRQNLSSKCLTTDAQLDRTVATTGIPREEIAACVHEWMEKIPLRFLSLCARRKLLRYIHQWHGLGVPMGIYSDYPARDKLNTLGLESKIPVVVCSSDLDVRAFKPETRGFEIAAQKMGLSPSQIVYVGDREDVDAIGAENAGMTPIILHGIWKKNRKLKTILTLDILDSQLKKIYES